ncbi:MAG: hypothetical protein PHW02_06895 [bacterium]|nr:hypothetical protein [bacterium]
MKRFMTTFGILASVALLLIMPVTAKNGNFGMNKDGMGMMNHQQGGIMNVPDLSEEQIAKIEKIQINHQKKAAELQYKRALKMIDLHEAMQINIDEKKALSAVEELGKIETELEKARITNHFEIRKVLTKDQQKFFDMKRMGMGMGMGMKDGKGMNNGCGGNSSKADCGDCGK